MKNLLLTVCISNR